MLGPKDVMDDIQMIKYEKTREETKQNKQNIDKCIDRLNQSMMRENIAPVKPTACKLRASVD